MLRFKLDGIHNRLLRDWSFSAHKRSCVGSGLGEARLHARKHGAAGVWRANDSFILFYRDGEKVYRRTWRHAAPN